MEDHYLEVACGCGARRVIGIKQMADDPRIRTMTLATVAVRLQRADCLTGPDEVHLTATTYGLRPPAFGGSAAWTLLLWQRATRGGSYHRRHMPEPG